MTQEPCKADLLAFKSGGPLPPRCAALVLQAPPTDYVAEVVVDLAGPEVASWKQVLSIGILAFVCVSG
jgi:Cu2+-containing amine oxidase